MLDSNHPDICPSRYRRPAGLGECRDFGLEIADSREKEREGEREGKGENETVREREREVICVCVSVCRTAGVDATTLSKAAVRLGNSILIHRRITVRPYRRGAISRRVDVVLDDDDDDGGGCGCGGGVVVALMVAFLRLCSPRRGTDIGRRRRWY